MRQSNSVNLAHTVERVRRLHAEVEKATGAVIPVTLWEGTALGEGRRQFNVVLTSPGSVRSALGWPPGLRFGESYIHGSLDIEGDVIQFFEELDRITHSDISQKALLKLILRVLALPRRQRPARNSYDGRARIRGKMHSRQRDRAAIEFHYDRTFDFYSRFLGPSMVYSCAYFADHTESLEAAQLRKMDVICRKLRLRPGQMLLDIGCGWGGLVSHAAREYGVRAVGVTLSRKQAQAARAKVLREGLESRVTIQHGDYRDVEGTYDAIASVGMLEHVGPQHLDSYMSRLLQSLRVGGLVLNHGIVFDRNPRRIRKGNERTFLTKYVFPDGGLVPTWRLVKAVQHSGLRLIDVEQLRAHYSLTLRHWLTNLEANHEAVLEVVPEVDYRIWRLFIAMSAYGFDCGEMSVVQVLAEKPLAHGTSSLPLGREWMLPPGQRTGEPSDSVDHQPS